MMACGGRIDSWGEGVGDEFREVATEEIRVWLSRANQDLANDTYGLLQRLARLAEGRGDPATDAWEEVPELGEKIYAHVSGDMIALYAIRECEGVTSKDVLLLRVASARSGYAATVDWTMSRKRLNAWRRREKQGEREPE